VGRNQRIAAWAFVAFLALGCGRAAGASLTLPATPPITSAAITLPTPVEVPSLQLTPQNPLPQVPQTTTAPPAPAPTASSAPAAPAEQAQAATTAHQARIPVETGARTFGTNGRSASSPSRGQVHASSFQRARRAKRSRASRSGTKERLPTFAPSKFDRLGKIVDSLSPAPLPTIFPVGDSEGGGMSWALPLLALMLPIGLCGLLQLGRRPREVDG
jgi:hypothetical protein